MIKLIFDEIEAVLGSKESRGFGIIRYNLDRLYDFMHDGRQLNKMHELPCHIRYFGIMLTG